MSKPKDSPYTQTPNVIFDHMKKMKESELKVTMAIVRATYGYHVDESKMSIKDIMEATGLSRQGAIDGTEHGMARGTIKRTPYTGDNLGSYVYALVIDNPPTESNQSTEQTSQQDRPVNRLDQNPSKLLTTTSQQIRQEPVNNLDGLGQSLITYPRDFKENSKENSKERERKENGDLPPGDEVQSAPPAGSAWGPPSKPDHAKVWRRNAFSKLDLSRMPVAQSPVWAMAIDICGPPGVKVNLNLWSNGKVLELVEALHTLKREGATEEDWKKFVHNYRNYDYRGQKGEPLAVSQITQSWQTVLAKTRPDTVKQSIKDEADKLPTAAEMQARFAARAAAEATEPPAPVRPAPALRSGPLGPNNTYPRPAAPTTQAVH